MKFNILTK